MNIWQMLWVIRKITSLVFGAAKGVTRFGKTSLALLSSLHSSIFSLVLFVVCVVTESQIVILDLSSRIIWWRLSEAEECAHLCDHEPSLPSSFRVHSWSCRCLAGCVLLCLELPLLLLLDFLVQSDCQWMESISSPYRSSRAINLVYSVCLLLGRFFFVSKSSYLKGGILWNRRIWFSLL